MRLQSTYQHQTTNVARSQPPDLPTYQPINQPSHLLMRSDVSDEQSTLKPSHVSPVLRYLTLGTRATCWLICTSRTSGRPQASPRRRWRIYYVLSNNLHLHLTPFLNGAAILVLTGAEYVMSLLQNLLLHWTKLNWTGFANVTNVIAQV